ncbi:uncharacterized protein A4U43_C03F13340 [Asparagus officinalis]|uniref:Strictosidine synthase conserved region domain-containing protein n=1 Tax=Asparagus officinalis TaxID=4686 RepID=A0A5P1FAA5_ASPOF|nr:uncharacterized protein A4U43_C03F13340 [Asparagus officinalis]
MSRGLLTVGFVLASLLSAALHVALNSPISPLPLSLPSSKFCSNNLLQGVIKLGEGKLVGPEDVLVGPDGVLFTATRDGWIKRIQPDGSVEDWRFIGGPAVLGITASRDGDLLACDAHKGLLKVGDGGVNVLATRVDDDGSVIRFADEAVEASDGSVYFTDASSKFGLSDWLLDVLEAKPHGRLLKYDPVTKHTSVVLSDLAFANGVTLSPDEDFLIVCETWRYTPEILARRIKPLHMEINMR